MKDMNETQLYCKLKFGDPRILDSASHAYFYAKHHGDRFEEGEDIISKNAHFSYYYAAYVLHGEFPAGEDAINSNMEYSGLYHKLIHGHDA